VHFEKDDNRRNRRAGCDEIRERRRRTTGITSIFGLVNLHGIQIGRFAMVYTFFQSGNQQ